MEHEAEKFCKACHGCQLVTKGNPPEPISPSQLPAGPWQDLGLDFLGPLPSGHSILVVIDYYSRYYELAIMKSTTAAKTVAVLKTIFARHGNPMTIHTDNGPQFISDTFAEYMKSIGAGHLRVTPKWPQANGEVERQNQSLLKRMQIAQAEGKDWRDKILDYVMGYRAKMHLTTGQSPAKLLFQREIRTKMPELRGYQATDDQAISWITPTQILCYMSECGDIHTRNTRHNNGDESKSPFGETRTLRC
jgi:transposase InsO family protein